MVRKDNMGSSAVGVKANEHGSSKIVSGARQERDGRKAELRTIIDSSTRFRDLRLSSKEVFRVLLIFAGKFNRDGDGNEYMFVKVYKGQKDIAKRAGVDVRTVRRALKQLADAGFVVAGQEPGFQYRRDAYSIIVPREIIDEYLTRVQEREQAKVARQERRSTSGTSGQNVRNIRADCPEQPDKMSASSSIHQKNPSEETTTTEAHHTQTTRAASTNAGHGGGGGVFLNDEMQRAKAKLRELGVRMNDRAIENMLRAGNITEAIVEAAWRDVPESAESIAAVLVSMLQSADIVEDLRAKTVEESKAIEVKNERAAFDRWPEDTRRFWCEKAREHWPNLGNAESRPDHDPVIQAAAFGVYRLSKSNIVEAITEAIERAKTSRDDHERQGKQAIADRITPLIENVEAVENDPSFITAAVEVFTIADAGERFKALARLAAGRVENTKGVASC